LQYGKGLYLKGGVVAQVIWLELFVPLQYRFVKIPAAAGSAPSVESAIAM
jgi:hypothetical protein